MHNFFHYELYELYEFYELFFLKQRITRTKRIYLVKNYRNSESSAKLVWAMPSRDDNQRKYAAAR